MIAAAFVAALFGSPAIAEDPVIKLEEIPLLPLFCQHQPYTHAHNAMLPKPDQATLARVSQITQSGCAGWHHFCWALAWRNRGIFAEQEQRQKTFYLERSVADFGYVLNSSPPKCVLIPEIHVETGESQLLLGDHKEAEVSFQRALKAKPGFTRAYLGLSDLYENRGQVDKAIAILQQAIKSKPNSKSLKIKLKRVQDRKSGKPAPASASPAAKGFAPPKADKPRSPPTEAPSPQPAG